MKNYQLIITLIENLLKDHDCIIIPNFGGFVVNSEDFKLNLEQSIISPRKRWIAFNERLKSDDGILATQWAALHSLTNKIAFQEINQFGKYIKSELAKNQSFMLGNIGQFFLSVESNIVFSPNQKMNYDLTMFGLSDVNISQENTIVEKIPPVLIPLVNHSALHPEMTTEEVESENQTKNGIIPKYIIYTIFAFIIAAFSAYFLTDPKSQYVHSSFSPFTLKLSKITNSESNKEITPSNKKDNLTKATLGVNSQPVSSKSTQEAIKEKKTDKIYLIAASFLTLAKAEIALEEFKLKGFGETEILTKGDDEKYFRVSLGTEKSFDAGYKAASKIKEENKLDIWVYKP